MAASSLPITASAAPAPPAATRGPAPVAGNANANSAGSQSNGDAGANDFLAMFAQMIMSSDGVADGVASELSGEKLSEKSGEKNTEEAEDAAAATLQPFAAMIQLPVQPAPPKMDMMELLGAQLSVAGTDKALGAAAKAVGELLSQPAVRTETTAGDSDAARNPELTSADLAALSTANTAKTDSAPTVQIPAHVGSQHWPDQIGAQLTMMAHKGEHTASLKLSPEHLGPMEVHIAVRDDQTTVWFGAQHADTRAAIEQALPRLRELFAAQGMSLNDAGVYREAPRDAPKNFGSSRGGDQNADSESVSAVAARIGLLDAYA